MSLAITLKDFVTHPSTKSILDEKLDLAFHEDSVYHHAKNYCSRAFSARRRQRALRITSIPVRDFLRSDICEQCVKNALTHNRRYVTGPSLISLHYLYVTLLSEVKSFAVIRKNLSLDGRQKRVVLIEERILECQVARTDTDSTDLHELFEDLENKYVKVKAALEQSTRGDSIRERTETIIKKALVPAALRGSPGVLDEKEILIAICPNPENLHYTAKTVGHVKTVLGLYSVRSDDGGMILKAPAYVARYLQDILPGWDRIYTFLIMTAPVPEDASVLETAVELWDPTPKATFLSLAAAVEAAEASA